MFLPRERYTTQNRLKVQDVLMSAFGGTGVEHTIRVSESVLARLHVVVRTAAPLTADIDVHGLEEKEARAIYRAKYVDEPKFTAIEDGRLRALLVDIAVNSGPVTAIRMLQRVCGVPVDGVLGTHTLAAAAVKATVVADLIRERADFYLQLGLGGSDVKAFLRDNPKSQLHFLKGWMRRALEFTA